MSSGLDRTWMAQGCVDVIWARSHLDGTRLWMSSGLDVDTEERNARVKLSGATLSFPGLYFTV